MSSIRETQIERVLSDTVKLLYSQGVKPTDADINKRLSQYFAKYPPGKPLPIDMNAIVAEGGRSNVDAFNDSMLALMLNIENLYRTTANQVNDVMALTTQLQDHLTRLKNKRKALNVKIDNHLMGLYNSDGYFYSISDSFSNINLVDLNFTSAYINTEEGSVILPTISRFSDRIKPENLSLRYSRARVNNAKVDVSTISPISFALDGNTNTVWSCEVTTPVKGEVILEVELDVLNFADVNSVEVDPFGLTAAQWSMQYSTVENGSVQYQPFGGRVVTSSNKFSFKHPANKTASIKMTLRKTEPDYEKAGETGTSYRYIFGAKEIVVSNHVYDSVGIVVSEPLSIGSTGDDGYTIDAVSVVVSDLVPDDTSIKYFIAEDMPNAESIGDFEWKEITPIAENTNAGSTIHFNGAQRIYKDIITTESVNSLQKIEIDTTNGDPNSRNPSYGIINGDPIYRLAKFEDTPILDTMKIEEGINTVKIYHDDITTFAGESLESWSQIRESGEPIYAKIDDGNEFFYGGDVGESGRSVLVETYLEVPSSIDPIVAELKKGDPNSESWKVRAFLNGNEVGYIDSGVSSANLSWPVRQGVNHICLLINIPKPTDERPNPYVGTVDLLNGTDLFDYGLVKLNTWNYIDMFDMKYNQPNSASTFTIYNNELVSRRKPLGDMRVSYFKTTDNGPDSIRFRADLQRNTNGGDVTPQLLDYRLRFSYSQDG